MGRGQGGLSGVSADQKVVNFEQILFVSGRMLHLIEAMCSSKSGGNLETTDMKKLSVLAIIVGGALLAAAPFSLQWSPEKNVVLSLDRADARVGRPLTATSVAGVSRRAHRRAYRRGY
jgi:hypothetical protein